ncbi:MAG TPA: FtsW/RodA/SpoVE family cell cycle protein [Aggregatilineales bacterium]|nr:FtsW/RodA/SpoVE family cell cycle protein [Aggregatilineales bacterium]
MRDTSPLGLPLNETNESFATSVNARERRLLTLAGLFVVTIHTGLILARQISAIEYWHVVIWIVCAVFGHLTLQRRLPRRDPFLFPIVMLLTGWGLTLIDRLAPPFASRQTLWLIISVGALLALVSLPGDLRWLRRYRYLWLTGGLGLLLLTILIGTNPSGGGPRLWLGVPDVYFQPSEVLKVLLVAYFASYLADHQALLGEGGRIGAFRLPSLRFLGPVLIVWGLTVLILVWQQNLGTATLFFVIFLAMLYLATNDVKQIIAGIVVLGIATVVGYQRIAVVRLRVTIWADPWPYVRSTSFQIVQSLLAFAAGGVFGQGVGQGSPTYIPVVHSDFVFAAIAEEWGLIGTLAVTLCFALLVMRGMRIAAQMQGRSFRAYLAAGVSITLAAQSLLITGGVLKLIPMTGVTLPFMSYGGSSLLAYFLMAGLLIVLSNGV